MNIESQDLEKLLESHLQKPEKVFIYKPRVEDNMTNGIVNFKATWSWWAFFGGWAFFLYRKMYVQAAIFFILGLFTAVIPFGWLILSTVAAISAFYFYTKKFDNDLLVAGYGEKSIDDVRQTLNYLGGYHSWVVIAAVVYYGFLALFAVPILLTSLAIG